MVTVDTCKHKLDEVKWKMQRNLIYGVSISNKWVGQCVCVCDAKKKRKKWNGMKYFVYLLVPCDKTNRMATDVNSLVCWITFSRWKWMRERMRVGGLCACYTLHQRASKGYFSRFIFFAEAFVVMKPALGTIKNTIYSYLLHTHIIWKKSIKNWRNYLCARVILPPHMDRKVYKLATFELHHELDGINV